ncbi:MAG: ABC-F family ATP-binding cassette domain-containing protein, partial [Planctomycetota bacterium]
MASVVVQNVTKQFGPQVVLENVSLEVHTGELVGLVGANGAGKTTLFKLIVGQESPDTGTVTRTRGLSVGILAQEPHLESERTLHDEVGRAFDELLALEHRLQALAERLAEHHDGPRLPQLMSQYDKLSARFEAAGGYGFQTRLNEILGGLGFSQADHQLPISALSGGQKCRAALANLLLQERQLLLLDEPTNHLDIDATRWLEKFLAGHHGGAVIVSHDRYLLDRVAGKIIEVEDRRVSVYPGNYTNYVQTKEKRLLAQQRQYEKDQAFIEKERAFIAHHISRQRTREARGRRTRLERRTRAGEFVERPPQQQRRMALKFQGRGSGGTRILRCQAVSKRYGERVLFEDLSFEVYPGDRLGILGPNGIGKTTLLRLALGQIEPDNGTVELHEAKSVAYYDQEHSGLDRSARLIDQVHSAQPELSEQQVRSFLGRFLFSGDE